MSSHETEAALGVAPATGAEALRGAEGTDPKSLGGVSIGVTQPELDTKLLPFQKVSFMRDEH